MITLSPRWLQYNNIKNTIKKPNDIWDGAYRFWTMDDCDRYHSCKPEREEFQKSANPENIRRIIQYCEVVNKTKKNKTNTVSADIPEMNLVRLNIITRKFLSLVSVPWGSRKSKEKCSWTSRPRGHARNQSIILIPTVNFVRTRAHWTSTE